jgi:hypothetical protein
MEGRDTVGNFTEDRLVHRAIHWPPDFDDSREKIRSKQAPAAMLERKVALR